MPNTNTTIPARPAHLFLFKLPPFFRVLVKRIPLRLIAFRGLSAIVNARSDRPQVQFSNGSNPFEPTLFKPLSTRRWPLNFSEVVVVTAPPQLWPSVLPAFSAQIFWRVNTGATRASIPPGCKDPPVSFSRRPI